MRTITLVLISIGLFITARGQSPNPFTNIRPDSVVIYDFEGTGGGSIVVDHKVREHYAKSVRLKEPVVQELNKMLGDRKSFGGAMNRCYDPHLGIIYFYHGKPAAYINVCMDCNILRSSLPLEAQLLKKAQDTTEMSGMSDSFRTFINNLLVQHSFSHQIETVEMTSD